jgi:hypothetical protein
MKDFAYLIKQRKTHEWAGKRSIRMRNPILQRLASSRRRMGTAWPNHCQRWRRRTAFERRRPLREGKIMLGLNRLRENAETRQETPEVLPSVAKAALILFVLCGTTEVVPFQNSGQNEFFRSL